MHYFAADAMKHEIQFLGELLQKKQDPDSLTCASVLEVQAITICTLRNNINKISWYIKNTPF